MEDKDYSIYEGKEVKMIFPWGEDIKGIVTGCDYDIGISIQDINDKDSYLFCGTGPSSPLWEWESEDHEEELKQYKMIFEYIISCIEKGFISYREADNFIELVSNTRGGQDASASTCSFAQ